MQRLQEAQNKVHCCFLGRLGEIGGPEYRRRIWNRDWHPAITPRNGTTSTPPKLVVTLPSLRHSTLQWHPAMALRPLPQSTLQWHPAMAPHPLPQSWSSLAPYDGTQQWHHVHCTLQWHPGATSNPPKWFVALPPIGSKNPYSYPYLGKNDAKETWTTGSISALDPFCPWSSQLWLRWTRHQDVHKQHIVGTVMSQMNDVKSLGV